MGMVVQKINYKVDKSATDCGFKLQENSKIKKSIPVSAASYIQLYNNMGRTAYQRQLNTMRLYDANPFPSQKSLREYQNCLTPDILDINPDKNMVIKTSYKDALINSIK